MYYILLKRRGFDMDYSGSCLCGSVKFSFPYDPMLQFKCHCKVCQKVFGNSLHALAMPLDELTLHGDLSRNTVTGGSGSDLHYNFCPKCGTFIFNKPDLLDPMVYMPAGLLDGQIEFSPTVELWTRDKPSSTPETPTTMATFEDNGTAERLTEMLENLDQRS
tara:strand:- start:246 stop:731 length:486 start_codon:yes stop_codon:yes gene_type:complete